MTRDPEGFLNSLKQEKVEEIEALLSDAKEKADKIRQRHQELIKGHRREGFILKELDEWLEATKRELYERKRNWRKKINLEKDKMLKQLFKEINLAIEQFAQSKNSIDQLVQLFNEVRDYITIKEYRVSIPPNIDVEEFKARTKIQQDITTDLEDDFGVVLYLKDDLLIISNTFKTRETQLKRELEILITETIWGDLASDPWTVPVIISQLEQKLQS